MGKKYVYLYVCDGEANCGKENCHFLGNGSCKHTSDPAHARYQEPHIWAMEAREEKRTVFFEALRNDV